MPCSSPTRKKGPGALLTHGGWGNFYTGLGRFLVAAGLRLLKERGYRCLILIAHSYGAAKAAFSQVLEPDPHVEALVLCNPAALMRDVWKHYLDIPYEEAVQEAKRMVAAGQGEHFVTFRHHGSMPVVSTARTFLSTWGPDPTHDFAESLHKLAKPLLVTVCEGDWMCMDYSRFVYEHSPKALPREVVVLPGGDHYYKGAEGALEGAILAWFQRLGLLSSDRG